MKLRRWVLSSTLLLSAHANAGQLEFGQQAEFDQEQQLGALDAESIVNELRSKCQIYEQHDQIYPFKIKVNYRGRFVAVTKKPFCATFTNSGNFTQKLTMKYNRFSCPDQQGAVRPNGQLQLACNQYFAQKHETMTKGPLLSFELASCSAINIQEIRAQTSRQLKEMMASDANPFLVASNEEMLYDSCANFRPYAVIEAGECGQMSSVQQQEQMTQEQLSQQQLGMPAQGEQGESLRPEWMFGDID